MYGPFPSPTRSMKIEGFFLTFASFFIYITQFNILMKCDMKDFIDCIFVPTLEVLFIIRVMDVIGVQKCEEFTCPCVPLKTHF